MFFNSTMYDEIMIEILQAFVFDPSILNINTILSCNTIVFITNLQNYRTHPKKNYKYVYKMTPYGVNSEKRMCTI